MNAGSVEQVPAVLVLRGRHRVPHGNAAEGAVSRRRAVILSAAVCVAAAVALGCLAVDGKGGFVALSDLRDELWVGTTIYSLDHVVLGAALFAVGVGLALVRSRQAQLALAGISGLVAAQLAGLGIVAVRRWPAFSGAYNSVADLELMRTLAIVMAVVCAVTAIVCLVVVLRSGTPSRRASLTSVPLGCVVLVGSPLVASYGDDVNDRVAFALQYGLPLGVALMLTAYLADTAAAAVAAAVIVSASLLPMSRAFVDPASVDLVIVLVAGCSLGTVALRPRRTRSARGGTHRGAATPA